MTDVLRGYAETDLNDADDYYGGYKEPRVLSWNRVHRGLSDHSGQVQHLQFGAIYADTDHFFRGTLDDPARKYLTNRPYRQYVIEDEDRRAEIDPHLIANGYVSDYSPLDNLRFEIKGHDWMRRRFTRRALQNEAWQPRITLADFPNANGTVLTEDGGKDYFNAGKTIPIIYGRITDTRLADSPFGPWSPITGYNDTFDPLTDEGDGQFVPIYVGDYILNGETWRGALVAAHYCDRIEAAFLFHDPVDLRSDPDWLTPRQTTAWQEAFGPGSHLQPIVINGHDYCMIFIKGYAGDVFAGVEPIPEIRQGKFGNVPIAINVYGRTDNGNGEGNLLTDGFDIYLDFLQNYVCQDPWISGTALDVPEFDAIEGLQIVDTESFTNCRQRGQSRIGAAHAGGNSGYQLDFALGVNNRTESILDVIAEFHRNLDCEGYFKANGQWAITMEPDDYDDALDEVDDVIVINAGSFQIVDQVATNFWNVIPFRHTYDYCGRMQAQFNTDWRSEMTGDLERRHATSIANYEQERVAGTYEFKFIRGRNRLSDSPWYDQGRLTVEDIMMRLAARYCDPRRIVTLAGPLNLLHYECGDVFPLSSLEGIGASGWDGRMVRIINHSIDPNKGEVTLDCYDLRTVIENREELTTTTGGSPLGSPEYSPPQIGDPTSPAGSP